MTIYNCDPSELIVKVSEELKKIETVKAPEWAAFVKTGVHKERPPVNADWWYVRAASILRQVYMHGPVGVSKLRTKYGGKKNRGSKPEHFYKGSGNIIRKIIQQLEKEGFVKKDLKNVHKGRIITSKGKKYMDEIAGKISKVEVPKKKLKKESKHEVKKETEKVNKSEQKPANKPKETVSKEKALNKETPKK